VHAGLLDGGRYGRADDLPVALGDEGCVRRIVEVVLSFGFMNRLGGVDGVLEAGGELGAGETVAAMAFGEQVPGVPGVLGFKRAYLNTWHAERMRKQADRGHGISLPSGEPQQPFIRLSAGANSPFDT